MAVADTINSIKTHLEDAYGSLEEKGATIPEKKNMQNLSDTINSISGGGDLSEYFEDTIPSGVYSQYSAGVINIIKKLPSGLKIGNSMDYMFYQMRTLEELPMLDTSNVTSMKNTFSSCSKITKVPLYNTSKVTNMYQLFNSCGELTEIPLFDTGLVSDFGFFVYYCTGLSSFPQLNTQSATKMNYMFGGCSKLQTIPVLNTSNVTDLSNFVMNCTSLTLSSLNNILEMCLNATKMTSGKTLKNIGLSQSQVALCQTLSNFQPLINAGWTTGY